MHTREHMAKSHHRNCSIFVRLWVFIALCSLGAVTGCAAVATESGPSAQVVAGDWDDLDAAVDVGLEAAEVAVLRREVSDTQGRWELVSIRDQLGELVIRRAGEPDKLTVEATIDQPRDPEREGRLVSAVCRRLRQLYGQGAAPLR